MNGASDDLIIDLNYCYFELLYTGDAATGWVLSNTDESGNISNVQSFIGNDDNTDPAVTEFTEENYITAGDSLEDAVDKIDIALYDTDANVATVSGVASTNASDISTNTGDISTNTADIATVSGRIDSNDTDISTNAGDIDDLESFTGSDGASSPDYTTEHYVTDGDDLEAAIGKLDAGLNTVASLAATGVTWQTAIKAITADVITTGVADYSGTDHFSDDDTPFWTHDDWADGDKVLSSNATTSGMIYEWNDGADQWVYDSVLIANSAVSVQYDFLDAPGSQEDGAAYMMNYAETEVIKIADFDLETAATISLSTGYTAASGTISTSDSVESAIQKLDANASNTDGDITTLAGRVSTNEGDISTNTGDIDDLEAAVGSITGVDGMDYTSTSYVTVDTTVIAAISALDLNLDALATATTSDTSRIDTNVDNVDTAHDNLAAAVLTEATTSVNASSSDTIVDTVTQAGNLAAKWFVVVYDGAGNRYAAEIYAMHDGSTTADLTEYAILTIGTAPDVEFDIAASGTNMTLTVDNAETSGVTVKTQRISVQTASVDTTAVIS